VVQQDPPHDAKISISGLSNGDGYMWRKYDEWVYKALDSANERYFGQACETSAERVPFWIVLVGNFIRGNVMGKGR
jgi:hypothetical protein